MSLRFCENTPEDKQAVIDDLKSKSTIEEINDLSVESSTYKILKVAYKVEQILKSGK